jgi:predicted Fe-S protein YdhL (DUF1289 family)
MKESTVENIKNPCIRNCHYNDDKICTSCFRTQKEVYFWGDFDEKEKKEILKNCEHRKKELSLNS